MPTDELDVAQFWPRIEKQKLERGGRADVDGERSNARESVAQAVGEEAVAPRREEREVEVGDVAETVRDEVKVTRVASEREGGAGLPLETAEALADEGEGVAGASVGDGSKYVGEDLIGKVR